MQTWVTRKKFFESLARNASNYNRNEENYAK
jgi:hypothetical protein